MTRNTKLWAGFGLSLAVLAACDGSDGVLGNAQDQFGQAFAATFNRESNTEPMTKEDLTISSKGTGETGLTSEPLDL